MFPDYTFHWRPVWKVLPLLFEAGVVTVHVAVLAMLLGIVCGMFLALMRTSGWRSLRWCATAWIELARNTPALFQIYFAYFGLGAFGLHLSSFMAMLLALTFNNGGYLAETFRGGLRAVPPPQMRAARSLGMNAAQAYVYIVIPQLLRIVYHPLTNQLVWSILMSSLGLFVGLSELSGKAQFLASKSFRIFEFFLITALLYYLITKVVLAVAHVLSRKLFRGEA